MMPAIAAFAWKYIILPMLLRAAQKEVQDIISSMSLSDFVEWISTLKTYQEYPGQIPAPRSSCNLTTKEGIPVNAQAIDAEA